VEIRELSVETPGMEQSERKNIGRLGSYCEILVPQGAEFLSIVVTPMGAHRRFASWGLQGGSSEEQNSETVEVGEKPFGDFPKVPIQWTGKTPKTRLEPRDNFRVIQLNRNGGLDQVEVGVATRGAKVFLAVQLQFRGLILPSKNGDTPTIVPALEQFSYPEFAGYNEQWPGILPHIQQWATKWSIEPKGRYPRIKWNPGPNPFGSEGAAVFFSSPVGGTGRLLTAKGVEYLLASGKLLQDEVLFLHFSGIEPGVNDQLGVEPMTWVRVKEVRMPRAGATLQQATRVAIS
jgi:hypothetical protein